MPKHLPRSLKRAVESAVGTEEVKVAVHSDRTLEGGYGESWLVLAEGKLLLGDARAMADPEFRVVDLSEVTLAELKGSGLSAEGKLELASGEKYRLRLDRLEREFFEDLAKYITKGPGMVEKVSSKLQEVGEQLKDVPDRLKEVPEKLKDLPDKLRGVEDKLIEGAAKVRKGARRLKEKWDERMEEFNSDESPPPNGGTAPSASGKDKQ